jgi:lipoate-protein ligase A
MEWDATLFRSFKRGDNPILRFFSFSRPTLTLGRLEANRIDLNALPYPHEVRPTGGRAVFHSQDDLCYAVIAPTDDPLVGGRLPESYRRISGLIAQGLAALGRQVELSDSPHKGRGPGHCFSAPTQAELLLDGRKVAGGAQAREGDVLLQQGVILLSVGAGWRGLLGETDPEKLMTGLNDEGRKPLLSTSDVERAVADAFKSAGVSFQ